jgi:ribosomal-protein-alanine N-acetyltransferase
LGGCPFWNRGYAAEAAWEMLRFGLEELELNRIFAQRLVRNPASGRVMQKAGLSHEARLRQYINKWGIFEDIDLYGILVDEWRQLDTKRGKDR